MRAQAPLHSAGALNLLSRCLQAKPGERLLLISETPEHDYFDPAVVEGTRQAAEALGLFVDQLTLLACPEDSVDRETYTRQINQAAESCDHIVFFSRIGDQLRFDTPLCRTATVCYTLDSAMLNSPFGSADHQGLCELKRIVDQAFANASTIRVTCPAGTDLSNLASRQRVRTDFDVSVKRFPMLVPAPVPMHAFAGQIAVRRLITATGSRQYQPRYLLLEGELRVEVDGHRIVAFTGDATSVARLTEHHRFVGRRFGIDPWFVHSWHAGIHPATSWPGDAIDDVSRWAGSIFGSPRILHFHTCGTYAPGEICWYVVDPTISLDGVKLWDRGGLQPRVLPEGERVLNEYPVLNVLFDHPETQIGLVG